MKLTYSYFDEIVQVILSLLKLDQHWLLELHIRLLDQYTKSWVV